VSHRMPLLQAALSVALLLGPGCALEAQSPAHPAPGADQGPRDSGADVQGPALDQGPAQPADTGPTDLGPAPQDEGLWDLGSARGQLALNEALASPAEGAGDWFELVVLGSGAVRLAEYQVVDEGEEHEPVSLPDLTLPAGSFVVFPAGKDAPADGGWYLPYGLGAADGLRLIRAGETVDELRWLDGDAPAGLSYGRLPDGTGAARSLDPSPGEPNRALPGPPLSPFDPERVVEVRFELSAEAWDAMLADPLAEEYHPAAVVFDGERVEQVTVRTKGNSSLFSVARSESDRYSFKLDVDRLVEGQRLRGVRKLNFNNGFNDPSMMREHLAYEVLRSAGLPASRTAFVDLWVDLPEGSEHMGLYTLVEHVDDDFLERWLQDQDGDLYKPEPPAGLLGYQGDDPSVYRGLEPESNEDETDHSALMTLLASLNQVPGAQPLESVLDLDRALLYLAAVGALGALDSYVGPGHNYYLYEDGGRFTVIPWDLNGSFGVFTCDCNATQILDFFIDEPVCGALADKPLAATLLADPARRERYHEQLLALLDGPLDPTTVQARIDATAALIRPYLRADERKFYSEADFEAALAEGVSAQGPGVGRRDIPGLAAFVRERGRRIRAQIAGDAPSTNDGAGNCPNWHGLGGGGGACGDGDCDPTERANPALCPQDCSGTQHPCGDGVCDATEQANPRLCPRDCDPNAGEPCGDGICDAAERQDPAQCPQDCPR